MKNHYRKILAFLSIMVLAAAAFSAGCSSGTAPATPVPTTVPPVSGNTVTISNFAFSPDTLTVKTGSTVTWTNSDSPSHTVTSDSGAFGSGTLPTGGTYQFTFSQPGTYTYHCSIHPSMKGTIIVQG